MSLEPEQPQEDAAEDALVETVAVFAAPDEATAGIVRGMLEAEGVPAVIGEQVTDAYRGPLTIAEGYYAEVRVAAEDADIARALLDAYERGERGAATDAELAAQAEASFDPLV